MGNDLFVDFPVGCWLWGYTQPLQRFSSHLVTLKMFKFSPQQPPCCPWHGMHDADGPPPAHPHSGAEMRAPGARASKVLALGVGARPAVTTMSHNEEGIRGRNH